MKNSNIRIKVHYPKSSEAFVVYESELYVLKNGGTSLTRDIMINAFVMSIPLFINFFSDGGIDALYSGNISAILNLITGAVALGISIAVGFIYKKEKKDVDKVMHNILSRRGGSH